MMATPEGAKNDVKLIIQDVFKRMGLAPGLAEAYCQKRIAHFIVEDDHVNALLWKTTLIQIIDIRCICPDLDVDFTSFITSLKNLLGDSFAEYVHRRIEAGMQAGSDKEVIFWKRVFAERTRFS